MKGMCERVTDKKRRMKQKRHSVVKTNCLPLKALTTNREGAPRQHVPVHVHYGVVALVRLGDSLCHPGLPPAQQPPPTHVARFRVGSVPQNDGHGLGRGASRRKLQQGSIFRNAVFEALSVVFTVRLDAL